MNQHRSVPVTPKPRRPAPSSRTAAAGSGWWLLMTIVCFCGAASLLVWGISQANTPAPAPVVTSATTNTVAPTVAPTGQPVQTQSVQPRPSYNPDPLGTLAEVFEQQGDGILLVGGAVLGGMVLAMVAAWRVTRIPKNPLQTGLGRTLTLLENNHRAGNLTPQRALEVARIAVAEHEQAHNEAIRARTAAYDETVAQLTKSHADALKVIQQEAAAAVNKAQQETSLATTRAETAEQRAAYADVQVQRLSHDLALAHEQSVEAHATIREQNAEIAELTQVIEDAMNTLIQWQASHKEVSAQYTLLTQQHAQLQATLKAAQSAVTTATQRYEAAEAEAQQLRTKQEALTQAQATLTAQLAAETKELARLRGVSLRELPLVIPDREGDLAPYLANIVAFIRGTTTDSGAAGGERTSKPVLSSWRDIRRLFQVLKGVGVRLAVPAHHVPQWAVATAGAENSEEEAEQTPILQDGGTSSNVQALTKVEIAAHNGDSDISTSDTDVSYFQRA